MATERQIEANKLNSQKSTGPKTEAGKAKSCLSRYSHGFASSTANLILGEDPEELKGLVADLTGEYQPATPTEQILVEKMALNHWISLRAFRVQSDTFYDGGRRTKPLPLSPELGLLIRYRTSAENAFHKAHNDLVKSQKERKKSEIGFEPQNAGRSADTPPAKSQTDPKTAPITRVEPHFPAEPAVYVVPDAQPATGTTPEAFKTAA